MTTGKQRFGRASMGLLLGVLGAATLVVGRPTDLPTAAGVGSWLQHATTDEAVVALAWGLGWAGVAWATGIALLAGGAAVPGLVGHTCRLVLRWVAPAAVRRLLEAALGVSLLVGPALSGSAYAAASSGGHAVALAFPNADRPVTSVSQVDPPLLDRPLLDRPQVDRPAPGARALDRPQLDRPARPASRPVTVARGDSLWLIAERGLGSRATDADIAAEWPRWYAANRAVIGDDPDLIRPGEQLRPPTDAES